MIGEGDWVISVTVPATAGLIFTSLAFLKFYGLQRGIEGGRGKPLLQRPCGT
jgi:hypothetical protein